VLSFRLSQQTAAIYPWGANGGAVGVPGESVLVADTDPGARVTAPRETCTEDSTWVVCKHQGKKGWLYFGQGRLTSDHSMAGYLCIRLVMRQEGSGSPVTLPIFHDSERKCWQQISKIDKNSTVDTVGAAYGLLVTQSFKP